MVPFPSFLDFCYSFHFTVLTALCHHYFDYSLLICLNSLVLFVILAIYSLSLYVIVSCLVVVFVIFFSLYLKIFSTIYLLLSLQAYQKFVSVFDIAVMKKVFDGIVCCMIHEHVDRSIGTMFENCCWMNVILECF